MSLFPLDAIRNANIDHSVEVTLEELRERVARFPFEPGETGSIADVLQVYDQSRARLNVLAAALQGLKRAHGVDVGAGFGFLPVLLRGYGVSAVAAEVDPAVLRFAVAEGIDVVQYRIGAGNPPPMGAPFDFAVLSEVIEHLKTSPVHVLHEVAAMLRAGGMLLLTTPNIARLTHIEALLAGDNFLEPFDESVPPGEDATDYVEHVREYSVRETVEAVEAAGFAVERVVMTGWGATGYDPIANPHLNDICVVQARR